MLINEKSRLENKNGDKIYKEYEFKRYSVIKILDLEEGIRFNIRRSKNITLLQKNSNENDLKL